MVDHGRAALVSRPRRPLSIAGIVVFAPELRPPNRRLVRRRRRSGLRVDILELRVTIGMIGALAGLAVGLQTEPQLLQQLGDAAGTDAMALGLEFAGQLLRRLALH